MIRTSLALFLSFLVLLAVGCSGATGSRASGKAYFGPGSGAAPVTTTTPAGGGCPGDTEGDDLANATAVAGLPFASNIDCAGDQDFLSFFVVAAAPQSFDFILTTTGDTQLVLFDQAGTQLGANDDDPMGGTGSRVTATVAQGTYIVAIAAGAAVPQSTPDYSFDVQ
jgi:hypothetical protein